jgi:hypothetical protein
VFLFLGIDMDHHIPHIRKAFEDKLLDLGGDFVRLPLSMGIEDMLRLLSCPFPDFLQQGRDRF